MIPVMMILFAVIGIVFNQKVILIENLKRDINHLEKRIEVLEYENNEHKEDLKKRPRCPFRFRDGEGVCRMSAYED